MLTIYLSHGLESGPDAYKVQALQQRALACPDCTTVVMDYRHLTDPGARLDHLLATLQARGDDPLDCLFAGSSLGGWLSAMLGARHPTRGCFLVAPAIGLEAYPESSPLLQTEHVHIIHGWQDEVVPIEPVLAYAGRYRCSLRVLNDDHRLHASMATILADFDAFLDQVLGSPASTIA